MSARSTVPDQHARLRAAVAVSLLAALVVFAALADELAEWQPFVSLDRHVDELLNERATPALTTAMEAVTWLGSTNGLVLLTLAACAVLLVRRRVRAALLVALALAGAEVLDALLKVEFARPRPSLAHPLVAQAGGYSFPSGHATGSMAVYGAVAYLSLTTVRSRARLVGLADPVAPLRFAFFDARQLVSGRPAPGADVAVHGGQRIGPHRGLLTGLHVAHRAPDVVEDGRRDRASAAVDLHQKSLPSR